MTSRATRGKGWGIRAAATAAAGAALAAFAVAGCAAGGPVECAGGPCDANPVAFVVEVRPAGPGLLDQQWGLGVANDDGILRFTGVLDPTVTVAGVVEQMDAAAGTSSPVEGAIVTISRTNSITGLDDVTTAQTGADGSFSIDVRPGGTVVRLTVQYPQLPPIVREAASAQDLADLTASAPLSFPALVDYYPISGVVKLDTGMGVAVPLPNVRIRVYEVDAANAERALPGVSAVTDCVGAFSLQVEPAVEYVTRLYRVKMETLEDPMKAVCGTTVDVCDRCGGCIGATNPVVATRATDAMNLENPDVAVILGPGWPKAASVAFEVPYRDTPGGLCPPATTTLSGSFSGPSAAMLSATELSTTSVILQSESAPDALDDGGTFATVVTATTLGEGMGTFTVVLPQGDYDVSIRTGAASPWASAVISYRTLVSGDSNAHDFEFSLAPKVMVSGSLADFSGVPVTGRLEVRPAGEPNGSALEASTPSALDGGFALTLSPGIYDLTVYPEGEYAPWIERGVLVDANPVMNAPLYLQLMQSSALEGEVYDSYMLEIPDTQVSVYLRYPGESFGYLLGTKVTDSTGAFDLLLPNPANEPDARRCLLVDCM